MAEIYPHQIIPVRDTDAMVLPDIGKEQLEKKLLEKKLHEPDYRQLGLQLQQERIDAYRERQQALQGQKEQGVFIKDFKDLETSAKDKVGGLFYDQIYSQINDIKQNLIDQAKAGAIDQSDFQSAMTDLKSNINKSNLVYTALKTQADNLSKIYPGFDKNAYLNAASQKYFYTGDKDSSGNPKTKKLQDINLTAFEDQLNNDPVVLKGINVPGAAKKFLSNMGTTLYNISNNNKNPFNSYAKHTMLSLNRFFDVEPGANGMPVFSLKSDVISEGGGAAMINSLSHVGKDGTRVADSQVYSVAKTDPTMSRIMDANLALFNDKQPKGQQVDPDSPEGDVMKRKILLGILDSAVGGKYQSSTASGQTVLGYAAKGSQYAENIGALRNATSPAQATLQNEISISSGFFDALRNKNYDVLTQNYGVSMMRDPVSGEAAGADLTNLFNSTLPLKSPNGKAMHFSSVYWNSGDGEIYYKPLGSDKTKQLPQADWNNVSILMAKNMFGAKAAAAAAAVSYHTNTIKQAQQPTKPISRVKKIAGKIKDTITGRNKTPNQKHPY